MNQADRRHAADIRNWIVSMGGPFSQTTNHDTDFSGEYEVVKSDGLCKNCGLPLRVELERLSGFIVHYHGSKECITHLKDINQLFRARIAELEREVAYARRWMPSQKLGAS